MCVKILRSYKGQSLRSGSLKILLAFFESIIGLRILTYIFDVVVSFLFIHKPIYFLTLTLNEKLTTASEHNDHQVTVHSILPQIHCWRQPPLIQNQ